MILNNGYQIELHVMLILNWFMTLPTDNLGVFCIYQYCSFLTVFFVLAFNIHLVPVATYTFSMSYILISSSFSNKVLHVNIKQALRWQGNILHLTTAFFKGS